MEPLPAAYRWLNNAAPLPRMVELALRELGTLEAKGAADSPIIMGWANEVGDQRIGQHYTHDVVPWCGLFMSVIALRAGYTPPTGPLYALNWGGFGTAAHQPALGDVLTFIRPEGGHVALYVGEDKTRYHVIGGNQGDKVCFAEIAKTRLRAARRPPYKVGPPASAHPWMLAETGAALSRNEG